MSQMAPVTEQSIVAITLVPGQLLVGRSTLAQACDTVTRLQVIHKHVIGGGLLYVGNLRQRRPHLHQLPNLDELTTLKFRRT